MDKIIGMGNALVDVLVRIDDDSLLEKLHLPKGSMQLIQEDTLSEIRKYTSGMKIHRSTGGSAGNTVCALAALGTNPGFIGKVGQDETGAFFGDTLRQRGVNALLATCDLPSGIASTFISTDGERTFGTYLIVKYVDIVFANESEALAYTGKAPHEALEEIASKCSIAVVKTGKEGSLVKKGTEVIQLLSCPVDNVLDTTGAGDFYAAGFMYGLTCGYSLEKCVQISTILATAVIQEVGTTLPAKKWDEIKLNIESLLQV